MREEGVEGLHLLFFFQFSFSFIFFGSFMYICYRIKLSRPRTGGTATCSSYKDICPRLQYNANKSIARFSTDKLREILSHSAVRICRCLTSIYYRLLCNIPMCISELILEDCSILYIREGTIFRLPI